MTDEAALRAELAEVRAGMLDDVAADHTGCRELVGAVVGGLTLAGALLFTGVALTPPEPAEASTTLTFAVLALFCWAITVWAFRPYYRRRRDDISTFWRLRRRERELLAQLPPGTTGRSVFLQYLGRFFGHPALFILWAVAAAMLLLIVLAA